MHYHQMTEQELDALCEFDEIDNGHPNTSEHGESK